MVQPSAKVEALITRLIQREGGYVDNASDAGGPTKYGITLGTLQEWRKSTVSAAEVQALPEAEARDIYRANYFSKPGFDAVADAALQEFLFDFAVNSGPGAAIKALQTALKGMRLYDGGIDGGLGPKSRAALAACQNFEALYYRTKCARFDLFMRYIGRSPSQATFATGWAIRLGELEYV